MCRLFCDEGGKVILEGLSDAMLMHVKQRDYCHEGEDEVALPLSIGRKRIEWHRTNHAMSILHVIWPATALHTGRSILNRSWTEQIQLYSCT